MTTSEPPAPVATLAVDTAIDLLAAAARRMAEWLKRYDDLLEAVGAWSMTRLTWAAVAAVLEILVLPIALITGLVFWIL
jgi:hypothetical protein